MNSFIFHHVFNAIMSFTMLHGIAVLILIKAVKFTVLYLFLFVWFSSTFFFRFKSNPSWFGWFVAYNALTKIPLGKMNGGKCGTSATENECSNALYWDAPSSFGH